ncbi:MAG TPA: hypothetical protein PL155_03260 [Candidatus Omnitrophota bacterium]|nr:hypothetical protein [Candidatus Omnitrophota bacterium]HPD84501.1 hypothetical protein [Candidatus Omnitrophota bacterium]HRZ03359.1 hypothetical protein [Candidatus Omnitrophota bacterium]
MKKTILNLFFVVIFVITLSSTGFAGTLLVPEQYPEIQDAIESASDGDLILVSPGTYQPINFLGKAVQVRSLDGPDVTIIDGNNATTVVVFENGEPADAILEGFTITNGFAGSTFRGGGIHCAYLAQPTIRNNIIINNHAIDGGGIFCYISGFPVITKNIITSNTAEYLGGGIGLAAGDSDHVPTVTNNIIIRNEAENGGGIGTHTPVNVVNNTIANNTAFRGGGVFSWNSMMTIKNTIIWGNHADYYSSIYNYHNSAPDITVNYSNVEGGWIWDENNIDADPLFVNPENNNFHLQNYVSPCIDKGDPADDYSQEPFYNGRRINIGAYGNTPEAAKSRKPRPHLPNIMESNGGDR